MAYEKYTLQEFQDAWFRKERSVIQTDEEFKLCYDEFVSKAGLYEQEQFASTAYIAVLANRVNSVKVWLDGQTLFLSEFGFPFVDRFEFIEKFGHSVEWTEDCQDFLKQLYFIELNEKKYISELENCIKTQNDRIERQGEKKEQTIEEKEESFTVTLFSLGKLGFVIDESRTKVRTYALMIKKQIEDNKR